MVGVLALLSLAAPPRCLEGRGDAVPVPVSLAVTPGGALVVALVGPLATSNLGGRTGVTTASVMASIGARIHVVTSLQSGLLLAEEEAVALELAPAEAGGSGAASRGASLALGLLAALLAVLGPAMVGLISKRDTSTSSLPSTVNVVSAKACSVNMTGGDSSMEGLTPKGSALGAPPFPAGRTCTRRSASARKVRWMGGVTSKLWSVVVRKAGDDAEPVLLAMEGPSIVVMIVVIAPPLLPSARAAAASSSRFSPAPNEAHEGVSLS